MKEIPGRMWGFALYKEAINSDPGVTGMDLLYLPPPLPPANTYNTTAVSKQAIHIDIFLGGGSSVSLRIASFYEQEGIPEISFHFSRPAPASQTAGYSRPLSEEMSVLMDQPDKVVLEVRWMISRLVLQ